MRFPRWRPQLRHVFAAVVGFTDGIMTALALASGKLVSGTGVHATLALRIAAASGLSSVFVFFTAQYSALRRELVRAERELSLSAGGAFAATRLGRQVLAEAAGLTFLSGVANVLGVVVPLWVGSLAPWPVWLPLLSAIVLLGILGAVLARTGRGSAVVWSIVLMAAGVVVALAGAALDIV